MNQEAVIDNAGGLKFIKQQRLEGKTQKETAKELGYNTKAIYNYLKKRGLTWSELPGPNRVRNINKLICDKGGLSYIIKMKNQGYTLKDISEDLGYKSSVSLKEYLKRNNIIWKNIGHNKTSANRVINNDKEIIRKVEELLDEGCELSEIIKYLDIPHPYLNDVFRRNGLSLKKISYMEHETPIFRLINEYGGVDYLVGKSVDDLADDFGYSLNYTRSELRRYLKGTGYRIKWGFVVEDLNF
jgi:hypothetical protein